MNGWMVIDNELEWVCSTSVSLERLRKATIRSACLQA